MALAADVYRLTRLMPKAEEYRLSGQMIRSAASVPANNAEGHGRGTRKDYAHFINIARGSLAETETFVLLVAELGLAPADRCNAVLQSASEVGRMLNSLRTRLSGPRPAAEP